MEQEKIIQIATSEALGEGTSGWTMLALSNTGRIFIGEDIAANPYKFKLGWKELPCPIKYVADAKELAESQPI